MRIFFKQSITVKRLTLDTGNAAKEAYVAQSGTYKGCLMSTRPEDAMLSDGNPAKSATLFYEEGADIRESDIVTVDGSDYVVKGVAITLGFQLGLRFKRAVIVKNNS